MVDTACWPLANPCFSTSSTGIYDFTSGKVPPQTQHLCGNLRPNITIDNARNIVNDISFSFCIGTEWCPQSLFQ